MSATLCHILVWAALLALLAITVSASFILSGPPSLATGMVVALIKAVLIFWFYMHLREEGGLLRLVAIGAGVWLTIAIILIFADYVTRPIQW